MNNADNFLELERMAHVYFPVEILLNLALAFTLGMLVSFIYKLTHKGLSYSQSFMLTNIFIAIIVCMVIMVIGNNLARAFALVGALSIIRFRTVVKDTKDTAYIFWALAAGLASGTGSYFLAISGSFIISTVAYILYITNYGSIHKSEFILQFRLNKDKHNGRHISLISEYSRSSTLLHAEPSGDGGSIKNSYDIIMKSEDNLNQFISDLDDLDQISEVTIIAAKNDIDY
jgi:uncharacterized membrane protein YhiD involved in acid resistance